MPISSLALSTMLMDNALNLDSNSQVHESALQSWRAAHLIKTRYYCRYLFLRKCDNNQGKFINTLSVDYLDYAL
jgi:hypothetical protein